MTKVGPKRKAMLHLPRFKLEHQFSAKDMLMALGMKDAFTDAADLSGISGNKDLQISEVGVIYIFCDLELIMCRDKQPYFKVKTKMGCSRCEQ